MDPQVMEQMAQELALLIVLAESPDPEGLFGLANLSLGGEKLSSHYALSESAWAMS